jgi:hypothetical protein
VQAVAVRELKVEFAALLEFRGRDADFFLGFANGGFQGGFPRLDFSARAVDLARAKSPLLADEQDPAVLDDEAEIGPLARLPAGPLGNWDFGLGVFDSGFWDFLR